MSDKHSPTYDELFPGGFSPRDEANTIVAFAFRNGPLETLHTGEYSELLENKNLSRITATEMKTLMISACEKVEELLRLKHSDLEKYAEFIHTYNRKFCRKWER